MAPISPTLSTAYRLLRIELYRHLDEAEFLAMKCQDWRDHDVESARRLIPDLVTVIRAVVSEHSETPAGDCGTCHADWPCASLQAVHEQLTDPTREFANLLRAAEDS